LFINVLNIYRSNYKVCTAPIIPSHKNSIKLFDRFNNNVRLLITPPRVPDNLWDIIIKSAETTNTLYGIYIISLIRCNDSCRMQKKKGSIIHNIINKYILDRKFVLGNERVVFLLAAVWKHWSSWQGVKRPRRYIIVIRWYVCVHVFTLYRYMYTHKCFVTSLSYERRRIVIEGYKYGVTFL